MTPNVKKASEQTGNRNEQAPVDARLTAVTKSRYDRQAGSYDARNVLMELFAFRSLRPKLWSLVKGRDVLEVGAGTGANMAFYPWGIEVTAIDLSGKMISQAQKRAEREGVRVRLLEMDAQDLQFPSNTFDVAVSTCVFCSVPDPVRGLREVARVLRPGGRLIMIEHVRGPGLLGPLFDLANPLIVRITGANINRRTVANVRNAGFEIESVESRLFGILKLIVARKGQ